MVNKRKYTTNIHAHRLRTMLRREKNSILCPASKEFNPGAPPQELWLGDHGEACTICRAFVGLYNPGAMRSSYKCPCLALGDEDAMKRTERALRRHYGTSTTKNS